MPEHPTPLQDLTAQVQATELPTGLVHEFVVQLARELAAEMARSQSQRSAAGAVATSNDDLSPLSMGERPPRPMPELPPRTTRELPARPAGELPARSAAQARPAKPDARPMRFVYGAGAVAAMSVMAVGLVQPDFAATADQPASNGAAPTDSSIANGQPAADAQVRHVVRYIQLQPGQAAPLGATVIAANAPAPRVVVTHSQPNNQPAAQAAPAPRPAPRPATRQSGKPR